MHFRFYAIDRYYLLLFALQFLLNTSYTNDLIDDLNWYKSNRRDQNQLPPVVSSPQALEHGLGVSLFARLSAGGMEPCLLNEQYRMHPKIAEFPSTRSEERERVW